MLITIKLLSKWIVHIHTCVCVCVCVCVYRLVYTNILPYRQIKRLRSKDIPVTMSTPSA